MKRSIWQRTAVMINYIIETKFQAEIQQRPARPVSAVFFSVNKNFRDIWMQHLQKCCLPSYACLSIL